MRAGVLLAIAAAVTAIAPAGAAGAFRHVVAPGESLSSVAASDGLSVEQLAAANALSIESQLIAGSTLMIPAQETGVAAPEAGAGEAGSGVATSAASTAEGPDGDQVGSGEEAGSALQSSTGSGAGVYTVQPGDTLSAIAARAGTAVDELAAINGIDPSATLLAGSLLRLPGAPSEAAHALGSSPEALDAASSQPMGAQAEGLEAAPPYTTEETVTASQVGAIAAENGVPAALAEAVADQESGFNNGLTSGADARGVMQVTPGTWSWIGEALAGSQPLAPASAASNIRAGVLLLHSLLEATGGDEALAVAGYYQGLPSVLQEGETAETEQYVASVLALREQFGGG
jgi:LysM repeat protein